MKDTIKQAQVESDRQRLKKALARSGIGVTPSSSNDKNANTNAATKDLSEKKDKEREFIKGVSAIQRDSGTYCEAPEDDDVLFQEFNKNWTLENAREDIDSVLKEAPFMRELRGRIVPLIVDEDDFWRRYFFAVQTLRNRIYPPPPPPPSSSPPTSPPKVEKKKEKKEEDVEKVADASNGANKIEATKTTSLAVSSPKPGEHKEGEEKTSKTTTTTTTTTTTMMKKKKKEKGVVAAAKEESGEETKTFEVAQKQKTNFETTTTKEKRKKTGQKIPPPKSPTQNSSLSLPSGSPALTSKTGREKKSGPLERDDDEEEEEEESRACKLAVAPGGGVDSDSDVDEDWGME